MAHSLTWLDTAAVTLQGFHFNGSSSKPRLEMFCELGCCLEDIMPEEGQDPLGLGLVQKVMRALLSALEFMHERGVVHRLVVNGGRAV
jgi:serine/threonine protein kinase